MRPDQITSKKQGFSSNNIFEYAEQLEEKSVKLIEQRRLSIKTQSENYSLQNSLRPFVMEQERNYQPLQKMFQEQFHPIITSTRLDLTKTTVTEDTLIFKEMKRAYQSAEVSTVQLEKDFQRLQTVKKVELNIRHNGLLQPGWIVDAKFLPEITMACPVVYSSGRYSFEAICNSLVPSTGFMQLVRIYNPVNRKISQFDGMDIFPKKIVNMLNYAKNFFDCVAIATPYHHKVHSEWKQLLAQEAAEDRRIALAAEIAEAERRARDPYLLGFFADMPYVFVLARWSRNGILPGLMEMINNTYNHLVSSRELIPYRSLNISRNFIADFSQSFKEEETFNFLKGGKV